MERRSGSVIRGLRAAEKKSKSATRQASGPRYSLFLSLKGGMRRLTDALVQQMPEVMLRHSSPVVRFERRERWMVILQNGEALCADAVCAAVPTATAAALVTAFAPRLADKLTAIPHESVATVNVIFRRSDVAHPLDGFGFVAPAIEKRRILGATFSSVKFQDRAPEEMALIRVFVGGAFHREAVDLEDAAMEQMVVEELRQLLGVQGKPVLVSIRRYHQAMPQYELGHLARVAEIEKEIARHPRLYLTGNAYRGVGIPDCVHLAEMAAERMVEA
jgi:oxygen-dependent protoporphyrinogen oxidase